MTISHRMDLLVRLSVIPVSAAIAVSAGLTRQAQQMGPFCCGERRMELLDNSLDHLFASYFQVVLIGFLLAIGLIHSRGYRQARPQGASVALALILAGIYLLTGACMVILSLDWEWPDFGALFRLGLVIMPLCWAGVFVVGRRFRTAGGYRSTE